MKQNFAIYCIKNVKNNKIYIGSSININVRLMQHKRKLNKNAHENKYLQRAYNKYKGYFQIEIIESVLNQDIPFLLEREQFWIDYFKSDIRKYGYNLIPAVRRKINKRKCRHIAKGYCNKHYIRLKRYGNVSFTTGLPPIKNRGCKIKECDNDHDSHGYCGKHYQLHKKYGRVVKSKNIINPTRGCCVIDCENKHQSRGFCHNHYESYRTILFYKRFQLK